MIRVGSFVFPAGSTEVQSQVIEAKSKVRKEIRIQSVITQRDGRSVDDQLSDLQANLERLDTNQASLSIHPGRHMQGRQRHYQCHPSPDETLAWLDLTFLTADRLERSDRLHVCTTDIDIGLAQVSMLNQGNRDAPARLTFTALEPIEHITIDTGLDTVSLQTAIVAHESVTLDGEKRTAFVGTKNVLPDMDGAFPAIHPGYNTWLITVMPTTANATLRIEYRDVWV